MTNLNRTVLYIGFTGDLESRIQQHYEGLMTGFSRRYNCKYLVYYESFSDAHLAISREKQIKKWNRKKKEALINDFNPKWNFIQSI